MRGNRRASDVEGDAAACEPDRFDDRRRRGPDSPSLCDLPPTLPETETGWLGRMAEDRHSTPYSSYVTSLRPDQQLLPSKNRDDGDATLTRRAGANLPTSQNSTPLRARPIGQVSFAKQHMSHAQTGGERRRIIEGGSATYGDARLRFGDVSRHRRRRPLDRRRSYPRSPAVARSPVCAWGYVGWMQILRNPADQSRN